MNWYAIYTKPRWEKKVFSLLQQQNIEAYLPIRKVKKQYSDRKKLVDEIVLPSYLFIRIAEHQIPEIRFVEGVVRFIYYDKKIATIRNREIEILRDFLQKDGQIHLESTAKKVGEKVIIKDDPFKGQSATITKFNKNTTELILNSLHIKLTLTTY